ncbi:MULTISPECIES: efflux RND transporter periplasmic adaptor subunit [Hyphobacterium]|uniref:Efflux RND transporter periplasmic adaptor subunit n=1 Tax=Hyphobacterium vulgare TaxID=1736751 RepID=A0ABV6ZYB0_9PROT
MNKTKSRLVGIFLPVGVIVAFVAAFIVMQVTAPTPERVDPRPRPVAVFAAPIERTDVVLHVETQGEVSPLTEIDLVPQVAGRITYVNPNFIEGGFFEAGETLIEIDDADYRLAVTRASAQVAQARQALVREEAEADLAAREWEELGEGQASPLTLRQPQMAQAQAALAAAEAQLQEARLNLQRTRISAPFAGRVRTKSADLGQYVGPGARLGQVFATDAVQIRLPLTNSQLSMLNIPVAFQATEANPGPNVTLSAELAGTHREWQAQLVRTDSTIDPQTRVLYAIAVVNDPYGQAAAQNGAPLPVGLFVDAEVEGRTVQDAYVMPRSALRGTDTVYVAEAGGTLVFRNISVIASSRDRLIVSGDVHEGEMAITSPVRAASNGMRIRTLTAEGEELPEFSADLSSDEEEAGDETETDEQGEQAANLASAE